MGHISTMQSNNGMILNNTAAIIMFGSVWDRTDSF